MKRLVLMTAMVVLIASGSAMAQTGFGVRAGVTADPEQFHFGAHYITDNLLDRLHFRPNLEIGVGNNLTLVAANFEFAYRIRIPDTAASVYLGAGPSFLVGDTDFGSDTGGGFNILFGLEHRKGLFGELKVGTIDSPDVKFTFGYTFR